MDAKLNLQVLLHTAMFNFIVLQQYANEKKLSIYYSIKIHNAKVEDSKRQARAR